MAELLSSYGTASTRPGLSTVGDGSPDLVEVQFYVDLYNSLDQNAQIWGVVGYMRAWWHDPRLAFNETQAGTSKLALMPQEALRIWQPDLYWEKLVEGSDIRSSDGFGESLFVYSDGRVWRSQQRDLALSCPLDLSFMPFDDQMCRMTIGLYSSTADDVRLRWRNGSDEDEALENWNGEEHCEAPWWAIDLQQQDVLQEWDSGAYSSVTAGVHFVRRSPERFWRQYFVPAFVLAWLSYLVRVVAPPHCHRLLAPHHRHPSCNRAHG